MRDAVFGPLVRIAAGGVATEIWKDEVYLLPPVARADVGRALRGLRLWPLLDGYRGSASGRRGVAAGARGGASASSWST